MSEFNVNAFIELCAENRKVDLQKELEASKTTIRNMSNQEFMNGRAISSTMLYKLSRLTKKPMEFWFGDGNILYTDQVYNVKSIQNKQVAKNISADVFEKIKDYDLFKVRYFDIANSKFANLDKGDTVLIDIDENQFKDGVYLVKANDEYILLSVAQSITGRLYSDSMMSANDSDKTLTESILKNIEVAGKVIRFFSS